MSNTPYTLTVHHAAASKANTPSQHAFDTLIASIEKKKCPVFFISPHLDDAILSAGGLIAHLAPKTSVTVITVFTEGSTPPYSPFAQHCLRDAGYEDVQKYFSDRRTEDAQVCAKFGASCIHLGFTDGPWRRSDPHRSVPVKKTNNRLLSFLSLFSPPSVFLYPKDIRVMQIHPEDDALIVRISEKIGSIIKDHSASVIACPLAVGRHIDHLITRETVAGAFSPRIYWSDFPYNANDTPDPIYLATHRLEPALWTDNQEEKGEGIKGYQTQMKSLFPEGKILLPPDEYYLPG